jgi:hypothetical protein
LDLLIRLLEVKLLLLLGHLLLLDKRLLLQLLGMLLSLLLSLLQLRLLLRLLLC